MAWVVQFAMKGQTRTTVATRQRRRYSSNPTHTTSTGTKNTQSVKNSSQRGCTPNATWVASKNHLSSGVEPFPTENPSTSIKITPRGGHH